MFFTEEPYRSPILLPKSDLPKSFGKFTDSVNLSPTAYWWLAFSSDLVVGCGIPCSCDHIISEFWNFVKHFLKLFSQFCEVFWTFFSLSLIFFYWFGRSVLFLACLCFVPPVWWRQAHYTHVPHHCQANFWKSWKKFSEKFSTIDSE